MTTNKPRITRGADGKPICGVPCYYGGVSATRKYSASDLGVMWHCNRRVAHEGDRCWQHPEQDPQERP